MSERKLTNEETDRLFDFCRKHGVHYYDLQIELVDHLAEAIENYWEQDPNRPFQQALNQSYKQFGIFSFSRIKDQKEKALRKKYNRLSWMFVGGFFKLPRIILTIALSLFVFTLLQFVENDGIIIGTYCFLFLPFGLFYYFYYFPKKLQLKIVSGKMFLINEHLKNINSQIISAILISFQSFTIYNSFSNGISSWAVQLLIVTGIVVLSAFTYATYFYVPKKIREHFKEQFPQFQIA